MGSRRDQKISRSIVFAIQQDDEAEKRVRLWRPIKTFFALYGLLLIRLRPELFKRLRNRTWLLSDDEYRASFKDKASLVSKGDMGYSGSTFFNTTDNRFLIKSIPRHFEHTFFRDELLEPYVSHMESHPKSLLVRITDFLGWRYPSFGGLLRITPTYHLVMENLLHGQKEDSQWQTFDLKPMSYFFPERDIAGGKLASEATKSKLADKFDDKILLSREQADEFFQLLETDTELLAKHNAVDYSLMLVRIPKSSVEIDASQNPFNDPPNWRTGVPSQDDKWLFRAVILDFFWAKHKVHAKTMTMLINAWRMIDDKGPMSITTTAPEYRERFLKMCREIVRVQEEVAE
ncbi:putative phosphatidylinositol-4-phosphate 5-kinase core protein [Fonsecaea pedrosoi]|nr:putative phosphatidylinositol-4-phosphate 5-kinase core protein [Fonsecaea pedrosoi]